MVPWAEFDAAAWRAAHALSAAGVTDNSTVAVTLPNCPEHLMITFGAWRLGACVLPLRHDLPAAEQRRVLGVATPRVVVGDWNIDGYASLTSSDALDSRWPTDPLADVVPSPASGIASSGSTGTPKIIVSPAPLVYDPDVPFFGDSNWFKIRPQQTHLIVGPLYHSNPFGMSQLGLFEDHTLVLLERFEAAAVIDALERHRVNWGTLVPTILHRLLQVPGVRERDYSSIDAILHAGSACPPWVKEAWIEILGPDRVLEAWGSTENVGHTAITGREWLEHRGSVGKPSEYTELKVLDENMVEVPNGEVGEIFTRVAGGVTTFEYVGAPPARATPDGFVSVGDLGWVDDDGYLFIADRRVDLIITGGANVYPAEVEAALTEHPEVGDAAVIGLPDPEWVRRVHAVIEPLDPASPPSSAALDAWCRERLASYKRPKSYDFVVDLPRTGSGKKRRSALVEERSPTA